MILQALANYYQVLAARKEIAPPGRASVGVSFALELAPRRRPAACPAAESPTR